MAVTGTSLGTESHSTISVGWLRWLGQREATKQYYKIFSQLIFVHDVGEYGSTPRCLQRDRLLGWLRSEQHMLTIVTIGQLAKLRATNQRYKSSGNKGSPVGPVGSTFLTMPLSSVTASTCLPSKPMFSSTRVSLLLPACSPGKLPRSP